ncbi:oxygen-dependent tRNA uridine(34) hydroxylase TrhO [Corynebacterium sanguinis]|uniref:oxygen-dependent tRNA uridine(34) hydroxylase TrhO n=1 Tax=Corynebacterium sanguinis TaxID=2594913 RepID=UPI0011AAF882|nr:rhodanese-related sulfurtransferase [Corynebacterium sanguinis]MCT1597965.1 rhodanese-related sulfurtransferase [Corynebacterium sanguinis]MCT1614063.1 rhodanese-related sulfurtransferase [Corynebacterium sanguinis]MCT1805735.1 rhodanese-related sulfurtransferase [Corynebacterium sanguinis]MCT2159166.1 rhodanese-related sulfurtransferase [Corynebacterium sanguinis]TVS26543.1 rhodanese-related sulfurtransferase [Corynebacterium sanguinis]
MTSKILLYYKFQPIADPDAVRLWQRDLCEGLGLHGRIIISKDGINGTVGGDIDACKAYARKTKEYFRGIEFKWSEGGKEDFPKLSVKARDEIVAFGVPGELKVDSRGVVGGGKHLAPEEVNELVAQRGDEVVFFDGRNAREAEIGRFKNAVVPDVETTHDFINELDSGKYDWMKDKPVVSYCTGGIRCEILSSLMVNRGFKEVYQIDGGIVRYGEKYGNTGLWEGSLYVFDKRMHTEFGAPDDPAYVQLGHCGHCAEPTNQFYNCAAEPDCRSQYLSCEACRAENPYCENCSAST